jgi:transposase InsO family protein
MRTATAMIVDQGVNANRVSRELKIPYTTLLDWAKKYREGGAEALRPRKPPASPPRSAKPDPRREAVIAVKQEQPQAGSRRIRDVVKRFFGIGTSETTVRRVLKEEGLGSRREAPKAKPRPKALPKRFERAEPNQLWQSDLFTFLLRRHERVYVAGFMDDHSRYIVSLVMAHHQKSSLVMEALARGIADHGAPREILTDQGRQYTAWRGSTAFEEELRRHGIAHVKSRPHHPQTCGKIERFWKTMWEEFLSRTVFADFDDCVRRSALFVQHYNFQRPHQALEGLTPADRFFRSAPQVRAAIESTVAANALRLAREQPPRKPFYLVGRLGDQDLTINASGANLKVRVGGEETTIALHKESDHDETTRTSRWSGGRIAQEAPAPADAEVAEGLAATGRDREEPGSHGAVGAVRGEAGDRCDHGSEDLARDLLPDGDAGAERDARGVEPASDRLGGGGAGPLGDANRGTPRAHSPARAGQAPHAEVAAAHPQVDPGSLDDRAPGPDLEGDPPRLDPDWERSLAAIEDEGGRDIRFDPDQDWRDAALSPERKLAGFDIPAEASPGEVIDGRDEEEEDLHAGAADRAAGGRTAGEDPGGAGGQGDARPGGARPGHVAQPLPDDPASGFGGARRGDHAEGGGPSRETAGADRPARPDQGAAGREREAQGPGGHDRAPAAGGERVAERTHPSGAPLAHAQDRERPE